LLLVDADTDGAIEEVTKKGIRAGGKEYESTLSCSPPVSMPLPAR
jgi:hypothetical protein